MKYILVIGDGMADNPVPELDGKTPLEAAVKPHIDRLAACGVLGSVLTVPEGFPPGSDTAIMSIFGCDPHSCYSGRAPLEAAAQGIALEPGDAAYRCNNVTLTDDASIPFAHKSIISHSAGGLSGTQGAELVDYLFAHPAFKALSDRAGMRVYPTESYRHIAVQKQADIRRLALAPPHDHIGERVAANLPRGCAAAETLTGLMAKANALLQDHPFNRARRQAGKLPGNAIWFWAGGTEARLPSFTGQYGKTGAVISAVPLCHGIARLTGLDVITVDGVTGELDTNYEGKVEAALEALGTRDFVAVHLEGPDECTHCGDLKGKLRAIAWLDSRVVGPLCEALKAKGEPFRMLILSDHKTLTSNRQHDGSPVPYILYDSTGISPAGLPYSEKNGLKGPFLPAGTDLMPALFGLT
ncbi:MAG: 2,3-bisphosphoglycerate-independent phosphoglycerate mutase [Oscillospiraceae bacterium]|jgi:2,3-bisphosphoglycerate-independent phosphoglycerate mutase|nr:2,3-bisphosphoglycerate-independent phosphoglycerate mutase [Oscillospiraceae bacterium]